MEVVDKFVEVAKEDGTALSRDVIESDVDNMYDEAKKGNIIADAYKITCPEFVKMMQASKKASK